MGDWQQTEEMFLKGFELYETLGNKSGVESQYNNFIAIYVKRGNWQDTPLIQIGRAHV